MSDDETGAPIHGARVELVGAGVYALSDSSGRYALRWEGTGSQRIRVVRLGYETQALEVAAPALGALRLDIALRAKAALMPLVRVSALRPRADAERQLVDRVSGARRLSLRQAQNHPLLAEADILAGFASDHDVSYAPDAPNALHVRGGSSDQLRFLVDGIPFYNATHGAGTFSALNPDAMDAVELHSGARSAALGGSLAASVDAETRRADGTGLRVRGGVSVTAARLTIEGPVFPGRSDVVLSARRGAPALFAGRPDRTRLTAAFSDWLAKTSTRIGAGTLTFLAAAARDRAGFATLAEGDTSAASRVDRHHFDWGAGSVAAIWSASLDSATQWRTRVWRAEFDADLTWLAAAPLHVTSTRQTTGVHSSITTRRGNREISLGSDLQYDRAAYDVLNESTGEHGAHPSVASGRERSVAVFGEYAAPLAARWRVRTGVRAVATTVGSINVEPRIVASFAPLPSLAVTAGLARNHQTVQSLRNPESPAAAVFGADLPAIAGAGLPVARSDEATLALHARLGSITRLSIDGYARRLTGLISARPEHGEPFTSGAPAVANGSAWGAGAAIDARGERMTSLVAAGISGTRRRLRQPSGAGVTEYQPGFAATRSLTAAAGYRVNEQLSLRSAFFARWGRRVSLFDGALDWEGCDALDGGCEIAGTPGASVGPVSGTRLPPYVRWDIGARRVWPLGVGGRSTELEAHATLRNVLDRGNLWGYGSPAVGARRRALFQRPLSVLTAGLDFRY